MSQNQTAQFMTEIHVPSRVERPLSPHLTIYRPIVTMVMSIVHRATGIINYTGMAFVTWWLVSMAAGPAAYFPAWLFFGSWFGTIVLIVFSWSVIHHMLGGIRHLIWDTGHMFGRKGREGLAWGTIVGSSILTFLLWIIAAIFA